MCQGIRQVFTQCLADSAQVEDGGNTYMKTFLRTSAIAECLKTAHGGMLRVGMETVGENGDIAEHDSIREPPTREKIVLHHYATRSTREYEVKLSRGDVMLEDNHRGKKHWMEMKEAEHFDCPEMAAYRP